MAGPVGFEPTHDGTKSRCLTAWPWPNKMAVRTGLEPATSCVTGRHSNQLNYRTFESDPYGIRTRVTAVKGRCLNHLTNGPFKKMAEKEGFEPSRRLRDLHP